MVLLFFLITNCTLLIFLESADRTVKIKLLISMISCFLGTRSNLFMRKPPIVSISSSISDAVNLSLKSSRVSSASIIYLF